VGQTQEVHNSKLPAEGTIEDYLLDLWPDRVPHASIRASRGGQPRGRARSV